MKFIIDNQLPRSLARFIRADLGTEAIHVTDVSLCEASDAEVWHFASRNDYIVVSKDEDFVRLLSLNPTARLLWVRLGNCRRTHLFQVFGMMWPKLIKRFADGERYVELR